MRFLEREADIPAIITLWSREVWPDIQGKVFNTIQSGLTLAAVAAVRYESLPPGGLPSMEVIAEVSHAEVIFDHEEAQMRLIRSLVQPLIDTVDAYRGFMAIE